MSFFSCTEQEISISVALKTLQFYSYPYSGGFDRRVRSDYKKKRKVFLCIYLIYIKFYLNKYGDFFVTKGYKVFNIPSVKNINSNMPTKWKYFNLASSNVWIFLNAGKLLHSLLDKAISLHNAIV